ncbi:copia protein [Tanacetum coccineum]
MTMSSANKLYTPYKVPEREFRSLRRHFKSLSLDRLRSPEFNLLSDQEYLEEEKKEEEMAKTMEQYMSKTRTNYRSGVARPKINNKDQFELKGQFLKELRENTLSGLDNEDSNVHIEKVLKSVDLFYVPNITVDQLMLRVFAISLTRAASSWLRNKPTGLIKTWEDLKTKGRSTETSDGLAAIQAQLNNLGREIKKVNEKVYAAQVGCEQCKGPHYTKDCPLKEEGKTLEEAYYT